MLSLVWEVIWKQTNRARARPAAHGAAHDTESPLPHQREEAIEGGKERCGANHPKSLTALRSPKITEGPMPSTTSRRPSASAREDMPTSWANQLGLDQLSVLP